MPTYRPTPRSQFDYNGNFPDHPDDANTTINGKPGRFWWGKNCTFTAAAMAMDRHTLGAQRPTPNQLRDVTNVTSPRGSSIADQRRAWAQADQINGTWLPQTLEVDQSDTWENFVSKIREGRSAIVIGYHPAIPRRYMCSAPYRGNHAMYVNEIRSDGAFLVFDPLCRPSDNLPAGVDRTILDPAYASVTSEVQPRWVPGEHVKKYAEGWFGFNSNRAPRRPGRVYVGYTKAVQGTWADSTPTGDVWAAFSKSSWRDQVVPAATPNDIDRLERVYETGDFWDGYYGEESIVLASPEQVVSGEEGRVSDWQPTLMGYGAHGPAFYKAASSPVGVKAPRRSWYLHPWDIPAEHFYVDPPPWPEGQAFLAEAVKRYNREVGAQAVEVVNRGNLWESVELGGLYSLDLGLQGSHPDGLAGTVRVVAFIPDEDSGTMQLLCEWIEDQAPETPHPDLPEPVEDVIAIARSMLGVPYVLGAESRQRTDCSGLVYRAFVDAGFPELIGNARKSSAGYAKWFSDRGLFSTDESVAERGDLIVYKHTVKVSHIGIYLGNGRVISALTSTGVTRHNLHGISVDFVGVLKVGYPDFTSLTASMVAPAADADPDDPGTIAETLLPQEEEWTLEADPWA